MPSWPSPSRIWRPWRRRRLMRQQNEALHKATRDAWLALYATFTPEQKLVVRDALKAGMQAMATHRRMHAPPQSG